MFIKRHFPSSTILLTNGIVHTDKAEKEKLDLPPLSVFKIMNWFLIILWKCPPPFFLTELTDLSIFDVFQSIAYIVLIEAQIIFGLWTLL